METVKTQVGERIEEARVLVSEGRTDEAVQMMERLLVRQPGSCKISALLCRLYMEAEKADIPKATILNGLAFDSTLGIELLDYASQLSEQHAFRESNAILEALVWGNPDNFEAWNDLGAVRFAMNDMVTAEKAFNQALALNPGYGETILNLTAFYLETARPDLAAHTARAALDSAADISREMMVQLAGLISPVDPEQAGALLRESSQHT